MRPDIDDLLQTLSLPTTHFTVSTRLYRGLRSEVERLYSTGQTDVQVMTALLTTYGPVVAAIVQCQSLDAQLRHTVAIEDQRRHTHR